MFSGVRPSIGHTVFLKVFGLVLALLVISACAAGVDRYNIGTASFDRYNIGTAELWIGGQLQVHRECERRRVVYYSNDTRIFGCTDFKERVVISVPDPKIIAHEWCHWATKSDSHDVCPTPLVRLP
jgi:hypothetical protein